MFRIQEMNGKFQVYHDSLLLATFRSPEAAKSYLTKSQEKFQPYRAFEQPRRAPRTGSIPNPRT